MKSRLPIPFAALALILLAFTPGVRGQTTASLSVVHSFGALNASGNNDDGTGPIGGVILGTDGNFYGTANGGGSAGGGVLYRFTPAGTLTTLYAFTASGAGGDHPYGGVIQAKDGNYYGTNDAGSKYSSGTVYQFTSEGVFNPLHTFGGSGNGALPRSALVQGSDGNFYGTTRQGGTGGDGTVFQISSAGGLATLYDFGKSTGHGSYPRGSLVQGTEGNFYGTTETGGDNGEGTVFEITSAGVLTTLHSFGGDTGDGATPYAGLILGTDGNFYGTTYSGGDYGEGTAFQITSAGALTTLYSFGAAGSLGSNPYAGLTQGSDGNFYGVTCAGGTNGNGTVFQLTSAGVLTTLYSFSAADASGDNADGLDPEGDLFEAAAGTFYGTAKQGGVAGEGTIFRLTVSPAITSVLSATGAVGTAFSFQIAATFGPTGFSATGLPPGLSVDPVSGVIAGTPTAAGTFDVGLSASNAGGSGTATLVITISAAGTVPAPVIAGPFVASATEGQAFSYQISASNAPTGYAATGLPAGLSVDATSGVISGAPTAVGTFPVVLSATNAGGTGTANLALTVSAATPVPLPAITSPASAEATVGTAFSYQIAATNNPTSYAATGLPDGLTVNAATGQISGTPSSAGSFTVALGATNAGGTGTAVLGLSVTANLPVVTLVATVPSVVAGSGEIGEFTLSLSAAQTSDVTIGYTIKGSAVDGADYELIGDTKKIKAGKTSKVIKIVPLGDLGGATKKVVKLTLEPGVGYTVGTTAPVKVKIVEEP